MKIVIINQHPHDVLGGSEIQCDIIATYLTRFGHQVTYLAVRGSKSTFYDTPYSVIPVDDLKLFHSYRAIKRLRPDIVYWRFNKRKLFVSAFVSRLLGSKFIYSISAISDSKPFVITGSHPFKRFQDKSAEKSKLSLYGVVRLSILLTDPIKSAFNYMAVPLFANGIVSLNAEHLPDLYTKSKMTIHNSMSNTISNFEWPRPYIVWVANIKRKKNPEKYYQLAQMMESKGIDFLMVGQIQDDSYAYLETAGTNLTNFYFLGPKSPIEVNGILRKSLFLVHTCDPEGFGNNFIQAWLQGKPTITLYHDPEEIIEREGVGFFSRNFPQLVEDTQRLIEDQEMRATMGQKAEKFAQGHFAPEKNVRQLERFFESIMTG